MATNSQLKIFQVFHKDSDTIIDAPWVEPLSVGSYRNPRMGSTHLLDNINHLNEFYNELTAIYWVWKNLIYDYVGFYHYRRVLNFRFDKTWSGEFGFTIKNSERIRSYYGSDLQKQRLLDFLDIAPIIIPRLTASSRTTSEHYCHFHGERSWMCFLDTLQRHYPGCEAIIKLFSQSNLQTSFNMFVMEVGIFKKYSSELFKIIDEVFKVLGPSTDSYKKRFPGFLAERFLYFWILMNNVKYIEVPVILLSED